MINCLLLVHRKRTQLHFLLPWYYDNIGLDEETVMLAPVEGGVALRCDEGHMVLDASNDLRLCGLYFQYIMLEYAVGSVVDLVLCEFNNTLNEKLRD